MNQVGRKLAVVLAAALAAGSLTGCESSEIGDYETTQVASYGDEKIYLNEANFWLRYTQWYYEEYYWDIYTYMGYDNMWEVASGSSDEDMAEYVHTNTMSEILQTRILLDHAEDYSLELTDEQKTKVSESVSEFLEENPKFTDACDVTQEQMETWMQQNALANLVIEAVKDAAEISVSDEECQEYSVSYIKVDEPEEETTAEEETAAEETTAEDAAEETVSAEETASESAAEETAAESTAEETAAETAAEEETTEAEEETSVEGEELANQVLAMAEAGSEFSEIEEALSVTATDTSYLVTGEESTATAYTVSQEIAAGEVKMEYVEGDGWYIVKKVNDLDDEATETKREEVTEDKQTEAFEEVYAEWADDAPKFKVNEKIWEQITITDKIYETEEETTEEETADGETAAEENSEGETSGEEAAEAETAETAGETETDETAAAEETTATEETAAAEETTAASETTLAEAAETTAAE